ncbi:hypothetical protein F5Y14DRAFT_371920 [Nemania sp. NC0429]|nr:hypothetical protein F5Y14DRAFT_371920 [Nemania sp. NC0429]
MAALHPPSYLFLSSGDFSSPLAKLLELRQKFHVERIRLVATELRTREETRATLRKANRERGEAAFHHIEANINAIIANGGRVREGFDATKAYPADLRGFDFIVFENPHSGTHAGAPEHLVEGMSAVEFHRGLLNAVMLQARQNLNPNGVFELTISGWPHIANARRTKQWDAGLDLLHPESAARFADNAHMEFVHTREGGKRWLSHNNGDRFQADVFTLEFKPKEVIHGRPMKL